MWRPKRTSGRRCGTVEQSIVKDLFAECSTSVFHVHIVSLAGHLLNRYRRGQKFDGVDYPTIDIVICSSYAVAESLIFRSRFNCFFLRQSLHRRRSNTGLGRAYLARWQKSSLFGPSTILSCANLSRKVASTSISNPFIRRWSSWVSLLDSLLVVLVLDHQRI